MPEFREDSTKKTIVVNASLRGKRTQLYKWIGRKTCPFDNPIEPTTFVASKGSWSVRAFKNKYPFVVPAKKFKKKGLFWRSPAFGEHEVIIETSEHNKLFHELSSDELELVFEAYKNRFQVLEKRKGIKCVFLFKNHGRAGGASVEHEHAQIISFPFVPEIIEREAFFVKKTKREGKCWFCDVKKHFRGQQWRFVSETKNFTAFVPPFGRFPFECWIIAKRHARSITELSTQEGTEFLRLLARIVGAERGLACEDYTIAFHNAPKGRDFHFHAEVYPRPNVWAGIELGAGVVGNPQSDEEAAYALREALF
ncbi:MAG: galactose-1-phosphate uridylyltransferase [Candidatus Micrarchaeia archaeon]|jgi:UDPglucose--hexose-1-phosphate uridylyltransferase